MKPTNIGFDESGTIKIFDFGIARELQLVVKSGKSLGFAGTPRYMANEVLGGAKLYNLSADVYSFGVLLWEICTCTAAYEDINTLEQFKTQVSKKGMRPPLFYVRSHKLRQLIAECWNQDPNKRPTMGHVRSRLETICSSEQQEQEKQQQQQSPTTTTAEMMTSSNREAFVPTFGVSKPSEPSDDPTWRESEGF